MMVWCLLVTQGVLPSFLWYKVQKQKGAVLVDVLAIVELQQIIAYLLLVSS